MKQLKSIELSASLKNSLEREVFAVIKDIVYSDVIAILDNFKNTGIVNDNSALKNAIRKGVVQYLDGKFSGKFSSAISKELIAMGAKFSKRTKTWNIGMVKIPQDFFAVITETNIRYKNLHEAIISSLNSNKVEGKIDSADFASKFSDIAGKLETQFKSSVSTIGVGYTLQPDMALSLAEAYNTNMKKNIQSFSEREILRLRDTVTENVFKGGRSTALVDGIKKSYGVSQRKAKFLASQETRLLTGEFTKKRYQSAGVEKYKWSTSHDERVRSEHSHLDGKIFGWDEAVIDVQGTRGNPKEAFGCRCQAIPII